jgi:hypothetical protein
MRLQLARRGRELALFNLGVDSKLRACDLVQLRVRDICHGDRVANRALVMQQKAHRRSVRDHGTHAGCTHSVDQGLGAAFR